MANITVLPTEELKDGEVVFAITISRKKTTRTFSLTKKELAFQLERESVRLSRIHFEIKEALLDETDVAALEGMKETTTRRLKEAGLAMMLVEEEL